MDEVNELVEAARLLREAAEAVDSLPPVISAAQTGAIEHLKHLGFAQTFVALQIAEWLEAEAECALAGAPVLSAALAVAEKVRRES